MNNNRFKRIRRRAYDVGRVRTRLAEILSDHFGYVIDPEQFIIVQGFWRKVDVYRWEVLVWHNEIRTLRVYLGCWQTMTDFLKHYKSGIVVDWEDDTISTAE